MKTVKVGNVVLGQGMPAICAPVTARNAAEVLVQARNIMNSPADLIEFRADYLNKYEKPPALREALQSVRMEVPGRPVLLTLRTTREGGQADVDDKQYKKICMTAIDSRSIELIDIEFSRGKTAGEIISYAKERGIKTVVSSHDFSRTPSASVMVRAMHDMAATGADIVKTAVMPSGTEDVLEVLSASNTLKQELDLPYIFISMGSEGAFTRVLGEQFGSCLTFASVGRVSAPGQMDCDEVDRMLRVFHRAQAAPQKETPGHGNIVLGGFMGVGKSTVAGILADRYGKQLVEMDAMIEKQAGMSISEIFEQYGEARFRQLEGELCSALSDYDNAVISCGGGTLMREENVRKLKKAGTIFLLEASPDTVYERVRYSRTRPMLTGHMNRGYISWLMKQRDAAYHAAADVVLTVDGVNAEDTVAAILRHMS